MELKVGRMANKKGKKIVLSESKMAASRQQLEIEKVRKTAGQREKQKGHNWVFHLVLYWEHWLVLLREPKSVNWI